MNCTSCGTPLAENTRFCPRCGAVTPGDEPVTAYFPEENLPPYAEQLSFIDKDTPDAQKEGQSEGLRPAQQSNDELQVSDGKTVRFPPPPGWPQAAQQPAPQGGQPGQPASYPAGRPQAPSSPQTPSYPGMRPQFPPQAPSYQGWGPLPQGYPAQQQPGPMPPAYGPQYQPQGYPGMGPQQAYPQWQAGPSTAPPQTQWMRNLVIGLVALVVVLALLLGVGGFLALQRSATPPVTQ